MGERRTTRLQAAAQRNGSRQRALFPTLGVRLELGRHLVRDAGGWRLQVPGEETKTGQPIALPFPTALLTALECYVAVHRPVLAALRGRWHQPGGTALWLSAHGSPITEMSLYDRVRQHTAAAFGAALTVP